MDVGAKNFRDAKFVDDGVDALLVGIGAVRRASDDEEVDAVGPPKFVEILDFFAHPL